MPYLVMLFYLGQASNAPVWYWCMWSLGCFGKLLDWSVKLVKLGRESK